MATKKLVINATWCKGCGICAAFCPKKALEIKGERVSLVEDSACILCGRCEQLCPDYAIYLEEDLNGEIMQWGIELF